MVDNVISKLAQFNRPHNPDAETAEFLFRVYKLLLDAPPSMNTHSKKRAFESAADGTHSWKVVCISQDALEHLAAKGDTKTLRRAHALSRELRFRNIFGKDAKLWTRDDLMAYFFEHDTCALVTTPENNDDNTDHWSKLHPVPPHILCKGSFAVYARKTVDVPWAKELWRSCQHDETHDVPQRGAP